MPRLLRSLFLVPALLLALASPALAGEGQTGTALLMSAGGDFCARTTCTSQQLGVSSPGLLGGYLTVCVYRQTYVRASNPAVILTDEDGCADVPESSVSILQLDRLTMQLVPTAVTLTDRLDGSTRTVQVSMSLKATERTPAFTGTESFYDDNGCLNSVEFVHRSASARGTFTIDGERFRSARGAGSVVLTQNRVQVTCP